MQPYVYVVYLQVGEQRCYWQGRGTRVWRPGETGRRTAAQFPDMHAARAAIASSRTWRRRLPLIGYEYLPANAEQPQLL